MPKGTIAKGDTAILENYVVSWQLARTMPRMIIATGYLVQSERGPVKHPLLSTLRGAQAELRASAAELGLTPVSRERLSKQADDEDEPMQWLLGGDEDPALQWATTREQ